MLEIIQRKINRYRPVRHNLITRTLYNNFSREEFPVFNNLKDMINYTFDNYPLGYLYFTSDTENNLLYHRLEIIEICKNDYSFNPDKKTAIRLNPIHITTCYDDASILLYYLYNFNNALKWFLLNEPQNKLIKPIYNYINVMEQRYIYIKIICENLKYINDKHKEILDILNIIPKDIYFNCYKILNDILNKFATLRIYKLCNLDYIYDYYLNNFYNELFLYMNVDNIISELSNIYYYYIIAINYSYIFRYRVSLFSDELREHIKTKKIKKELIEITYQPERLKSILDIDEIKRLSNNFIF